MSPCLQSLVNISTPHVYHHDSQVCFVKLLLFLFTAENGLPLKLQGWTFMNWITYMQLISYCSDYPRIFCCTPTWNEKSMPLSANFLKCVLLVPLSLFSCFHCIMIVMILSFGKTMYNMSTLYFPVDKSFHVHCMTMIFSSKNTSEAQKQNCYQITPSMTSWMRCWRSISARRFFSFRLCEGKSLRILYILFMLMGSYRHLWWRGCSG